MHNQKSFRFVRTVVEQYVMLIGCFFVRTFSRSMRRAEHEASKWIARLNADDVSVDDNERFEVWRTLHLRHARAYEELFATWRSLVATKSVDGT